MTAHHFCGEQDSAYRSLTLFILKGLMVVSLTHLPPETAELD